LSLTSIVFVTLVMLIYVLYYKLVNYLLSGTDMYTVYGRFGQTVTRRCQWLQTLRGETFCTQVRQTLTWYIYLVSVLYRFILYDLDYM